MNLFWSLLPFAVIFGLHLLSQWQIANYSDEMPRKYRTYGNRANPPVVVIPGLDGAVNFFSDVIPELTVDHYVIVFEIPYRTRNMRDDVYSFRYISTELKKVIGVLGLEKVDIVGESFGGIIAQHFALEYSYNVNKLVLLSSIAKTVLPPEIQFKLDYLLPIVSGLGNYFPAIAQMLFAQIHVYDVVEPSEPNWVKQLFIKEASFAHFYSVMSRIRIVSKLDISNKVGRIVAPSLVIYGEDDHFTKKSCLELASLLPNAEVASLPGGHLPHVTSPLQFVKLVNDFLGK